MEAAVIDTLRYARRLREAGVAPEQAEAAFRAYFALPPVAELSALTALTPGDFAVVRRKAEILGRLQQSEALVAMLYAECDAKPGRPRPIGFVR